MSFYSRELQSAVEALNNSDYQKSINHCAQALIADPQGFDALHLLGYCFAQLGDHAEAIAQYNKAASVKPDFAPLHNNISASAIQLGRFDDALLSATRALQLKPDYGAALNNAALSHAALGNHLQALNAWQAAEFGPSCPPAVYRNRVRSLIETRQAEKALESALRAVEVEGRTSPTLTCVALAHLNHEDYWEAARAARQALELSIENEDAKAHLASALLGMGDYSAAGGLVTELREKHPNNTHAANNLGLLLQARGDLFGAISHFRHAVDVDPANKRARMNLIGAFREAGLLEEARSIARTWNPGHESPVEGHHYGLACLQLGLWDIGWRWCEKRKLYGDGLSLNAQTVDVEDISQIRGRKLLLCAEQGLGDQIQFARYAIALAREAQAVDMEVHPSLVGLLTGLPGVRIMAKDQAIEQYDVRLPLMSAPLMFQTQSETVPDFTPYVSPDPVRAALWRKKLGEEGFKVGIAWQGNPQGKVDIGRSFPVSALRGIAKIPGVRLISLQKNAGVEQLRNLPKGMHVEDLGPEFDAGEQAFVDTAAVIASLDLVITSDTAIAHLAGAMRARVWVALKSAPDWRWETDLSHSAWYPSALLFRQPTPGDWKGLFDKMSIALAELLHQDWHTDYAAPIVSSRNSYFVKKAYSLFREGAYDDAINLCKAGLQNVPHEHDLRYILAVSLSKTGRPEEAIDHFLSALDEHPSHIELRINLANTLSSLMRFQDAFDVLKPGTLQIESNAAWHDAMSVALAGLGRKSDALVHSAQASEIEPKAVAYKFNYGIRLAGEQRFSEALSCFRGILAVEPENEDALCEAINCLLATKQFEHALDMATSAKNKYATSNRLIRALATCQIENGQYDAALSLLDETSQFQVAPLDAHMLAGAAFDGKSDWQNAAHHFGKALEIDARIISAYVRRAVAFSKLGDNLSARRSLETALALAPEDQNVLNQYGLTLQGLGEWDEAGRVFAKASAAHPLNTDVAWNRALHFLAMGDLEEGFKLYEVRKKRPQSAGMRVPKGEEAGLRLSVLGRRLFLYAEQGLGDTIQFCRYAEVLAREASSVELEVQAPLAELVGTLDSVRVIGVGSKPSEFDVHLPLMSAPKLLGTRLDNIPRDIPYLHAQPERVARWAQRIGAKGFRIGIAWQGSPHSAVDEGRSFPLRLFEPIARIPGVRLISLQKNAGVEQLSELPRGMRVMTLGADFDAGNQAFLDTAAVIANLDLVITSDTSIAHLAGAMGVPVWIALKFAPDWRWMLERSDSPWYPTARLFRQPRPGDWESVFADLASALELQMNRR